MKKAVSFFLAAASAAVLLCSCSGGNSNTPVSELLEVAAENGEHFSELVPVEESEMNYTYSLEKDWFDEFAASVSGNMAYAEEIVFVKASSKDNVEKIQEALEKRVEERKEVLQSYAPAEYDKLCKSEVKTNGLYVYLVVSEDSKTVLKAVDKAF